jgi:soluble lytic murein transglycosylase-like protein
MVDERRGISVKLLRLLLFVTLFSTAVPVAAAPVMTDELYVSVITRYISIVNGTTTGAADYIAHCIVTSCKKNNVDPLLLTSLIAQESRFRSDAQSAVGAIGLGQLMPATAQSLGVTDPWDIAQNVEGSARYFSQLLQQFSGFDNPVAYAAAAYNAGPTTVKQYGGIPPFEETRNFVWQISQNYSNIRNLIA